MVKKPPASVGDSGSIPEWGRYLVVGNGHPLHYSCLGNPMDDEPGLWSLESARVYARSLSFLAQPWGSLCWQTPVKTLNILRKQSDNICTVFA